MLLATAYKHSPSSNNTSDLWQTRRAVIDRVTWYISLMHLQIGKDSASFQPSTNNTIKIHGCMFKNAHPQIVIITVWLVRWQMWLFQWEGSVHVVSVPDNRWLPEPGQCWVVQSGLNHQEPGVTWSTRWPAPDSREWVQAGSEGSTVAHRLICTCNVAKLHCCYRP